MWTSHYGNCVYNHKAWLVVKPASKFIDYPNPGGTGICQYHRNLEKQKVKRKSDQPDTGQKELFDEIYKEHKGLSMVSGKPVHQPGHDRYHWCFSHIISKDLSYFKTLQKNIWLKTEQEHIDYTEGRWVNTYPPTIVEKIRKEKQEMMLEYNDKLKKDLKILKK